MTCLTAGASLGQYRAAPPTYARQRRRNTHEQAQALHHELRVVGHNRDGVCDSRRYRTRHEGRVSSHGRTDGADLQPGVLGVHDCDFHQRRARRSCVGMRALHILSAVGYLVGVVLVMLAPHPAGPVASIFDTTGTTLLYAGFFIMGLSQGLVEGVINPLIATIYSDEKTKRLNMLHAWWPGGMIIGGLLAYALTTALARRWQVKLSLIMVPAVDVHRHGVLADVSADRARRLEHLDRQICGSEAAKPLFLLLFVCMWMTAAAELGPDQWFPSVMSSSCRGSQGMLFLVYTAGLMFVIRIYFARRGAHVADRHAAGLLGARGIGLYWLGGLQPGTSAVIAFAAATIFGVGKTYFWPTMLGVTAEQFPRGGALLICA